MDKIDLVALTSKEPILFYDEVSESEFGDFRVISLSNVIHFYLCYLSSTQVDFVFSFNRSSYMRMSLLIMESHF